MPCLSRFGGFALLYFYLLIVVVFIGEDGEDILEKGEDSLMRMEKMNASNIKAITHKWRGWRGWRG
jgi:hypothetical protein